MLFGVTWMNICLAAKHRIASLIVILLVGGLLSGGIWTVSPVGAEPARQGGITLSFGQPVEGDLNDAVFRQVYVFEADTDDIITLSMTRTDGDLDPYLLLMDERGAILAYSDDDGAGSDALVALKRIPGGGRYFAIATRFGQEHGSTEGGYRLLLERIGEGVTDSPTLRFGDSVIGRISSASPLAFYFLRASRGDVINIVMRRTSGSLDPQVDLATVEGIILVSNDDDPQAEGTLDAGIRDFTVLDAGVYLVVATRFGREAGDTEGSFVLTATLTPADELGLNPDSARLVDYGMTVSGTVDDEIPTRHFRFDAQRGDVITVTLSTRSGNLDPLIILAGEDLIELARDNNSGGQRNARIAAFTLPSGGTYYLLATRNGEQSGQTSGVFDLRLDGRPGVVGGRALEIMYGATVSGRIDDDTESEEYVFFGQQGDVIRVSMERASGDLDALVTLYDSDRKQVAFDDDSGTDQDALIQRFELPRDDMFILVASRFERESGTTTGAYILSLELIRAGS
jgi:hypothetical protein